MATILRYPNGQEAYPQVVNHVLQHGTQRSPRGIKTLDAGQVIVILDDPTNALPFGTGRKVSQRVAAAEAIQLIGAFSDPKLLPVQFDAYKEDSGHFHGAYGNRIGHQMIDVVEKLYQDPSTRQAVITLWDPDKDNLPGKKDYPCTVMFGFNINDDDKLEMTTVMRSNDVWLGTPYDWFQFTQLQQTMATLLDKEPGPYHHMALSLHLYASDIEKTANLHPPEGNWLQPKGLARPNDFAYEVLNRAREIPYSFVSDQTDNESWYHYGLKLEK